MQRSLGKKLVLLALKILLILLAISVIFILFFGWYFSAPSYSGPISNHYDGRQFYNEKPRANDFMKFLQWMSQRNPGKWPTFINNRSFDPPPSRVSDDRIQITFINHATLLIQLDGLNILTDPIWSERCSPVSFIGPKRVRGPGLSFEKLPAIDVVLISHNHYDHLDIPTLKTLWQRDKPRIFVGLGNKTLLEQHGIASTELDWWQAEELHPTLRLWSVPAQHFSNRGLNDRNKTLWMGFVIEGAGKKVYFAGDTGFAKHFEAIFDRFGPMDVALLPIGAFVPVWFMHYAHISPEEALKASQILQARESIGIHFGTFALADDGYDEPVRELANAKKAMGISNFTVLEFGETRAYPKQ